MFAGGARQRLGARRRRAPTGSDQSSTDLQRGVHLNSRPGVCIEEKPGPKGGGVDCCRQRLASRERTKDIHFVKSERSICEEAMKRKTSLNSTGFSGRVTLSHECLTLRVSLEKMAEKEQSKKN